MTDTETENGKMYNEAFQAYYVNKDYDKAFSMLTQLAEEEDYLNFAKYHLYLLYIKGNGASPWTGNGI